MDRHSHNPLRGTPTICKGCAVLLCVVALHIVIGCAVTIWDADGHPTHIDPLDVIPEIDHAPDE